MHDLLDKHYGMINRCSSAKAPRLTSQKAQLFSDEVSNFLMGRIGVTYVLF